jgi:hypothetical protein
VDGNPASTNKNTMMVVSAGTTTNIRYKVDAWYELADCTTNGLPVEPTQIASNLYQIELPSVSNTTTVIVDDRGDRRLFGTNYPWQVAENDPYRPAILDWLSRKCPEGPLDGNEIIKPAELCDPNGIPMGNYLNLKEMYWLDIPPTEGHWKLLFGMTNQQFFTNVEDGVTYPHNAILTIKMMLTNDTATTTSDPYGLFHPPYTIQGLQPGSSSASDYASMSENWTSATFKVVCALNFNGQSESFRPVKWFVFDANSFNADGIAYVEVPDQSKPSTPGFGYGWSYYPRNEFYYKLRLDEQPSGLYSTELLRAVHTNSYNVIVSP